MRRKRIILLAVLLFGAAGLLTACATKTPPESNPALLRVTASASPLSGRIIVIDPGHGGDDPGTVGCYGIKEKVVTMEIGRRAATAFRQAGAQVVLTRYGDREPAIPGMGNGKKIKAPDLARRVNLANRCGAQLFLSIHLNNFSKSGECGAQVFYQKGSLKSKKLAAVVQSALDHQLMNSERQALAGNFYVCRNTRMPAIIVEAGFLSNAKESRQLTRSDYQKRIARAILQGVLNYYKSPGGKAHIL